jgi:hypothetical protein
VAIQVRLSIGQLSSIGNSRGAIEGSARCRIRLAWGAREDSLRRTLASIVANVFATPRPYRTMHHDPSSHQHHRCRLLEETRRPGKGKPDSAIDDALSLLLAQHRSAISTQPTTSAHWPSRTNGAIWQASVVHQEHDGQSPQRTHSNRPASRHLGLDLSHRTGSSDIPLGGSSKGRQSAGGRVDSSLESQDAPLRSRATRRHSQKNAIICCQ